MTSQRQTASCTKSKQIGCKGNTTFTCLTQGVEVEPGNPNLFWSAAEDGTVRQYDARLPSNNQKSWESCNCLLTVKAAGNTSRNVELKGISLNKVIVLNKCHNFHMSFLMGTKVQGKEGCVQALDGIVQVVFPAACLMQQCMQASTSARLLCTHEC